MSLEDVIARVIGALDAAGVPYMLTGSVASSYYGVPRSTHDMDVVVDPTPEQLTRLLAGLSADAYYVSEEAARDALRRRGQFNVIDFATGWKVDLIVRKGRPFSLAEFARRCTVNALGASLQMASAEDIVISKLEWHALSGSERQLDDAAGILHTRGESLDVAYVERWVGALGLEAYWRELKKR